MKPTVRCLTVLTFLLALFFAGCEKPILEESDEVTSGTEPSTDDGIRRIRFDASLQGPAAFAPYSLTESEELTSDEHLPVADLCSRMSLAFFKNGAKVGKTIHQTLNDANFGTFELTLDNGTYQLVAVAHSGTASATITSLSEVSFPNNKMTDTFLACEEVEITDGTTSLPIVLQRCVAKVSVRILEPTPQVVSQYRFYYTGGSSTLNPTTTFGAKQSRQTELRTLTPDQFSANSVFEVYTIPHEATDVLQMEVSALDGSASLIAQQKLSSVDVRVGQETEVATLLFSEDPSAGRAKGATGR